LRQGFCGKVFAASKSGAAHASGPRIAPAAAALLAIIIINFFQPILNASLLILAPPLFS
jgi:hypothetical protein